MPQEWVWKFQRFRSQNCRAGARAQVSSLAPAPSAFAFAAVNRMSTAGMRGAGTGGATGPPFGTAAWVPGAALWIRGIALGIGSCDAVDGGALAGGPSTGVQDGGAFGGGFAFAGLALGRWPLLESIMSSTVATSGAPGGVRLVGLK